MKVRQSVLGKSLDAAADLAEIAVDNRVAANLARKAALPTNPLTVDIVVTLVLVPSRLIPGSDLMTTGVSAISRFRLELGLSR